MRFFSSYPQLRDKERLKTFFSTSTVPSSATTCAFLIISYHIQVALRSTKVTGNNPDFTNHKRTNNFNCSLSCFSDLPSICTSVFFPCSAFTTFLCKDPFLTTLVYNSDIKRRWISKHVSVKMAASHMSFAFSFSTTDRVLNTLRTQGHTLCTGPNVF